jgi:ammonia channel protein AmtB
MFIGYSVLVNQNIFQTEYNTFLNSWLKVIENNRYVLVNFNNSIMVKKIISLTFPYYFNIIKKSIIIVELLSKKIYFRNYIWNIFLFFHLVGNNFFISNMYIEKNKIINNYKIVKNFIIYNTCNTLYQIKTKK